MNERDSVVVGSVTTYELWSCMRLGFIKNLVLPEPEPPDSVNYTLTNFSKNFWHPDIPAQVPHSSLHFIPKIPPNLNPPIRIHASRFHEPPPNLLRHLPHIQKRPRHIRPLPCLAIRMCNYHYLTDES